MELKIDSMHPKMTYLKGSIKEKDNEITNLKIEITKLRSTYEKQLKKITKGGTTVTKNSSGSNPTENTQPGTGPASDILNKTTSIDPYSASKKKRNRGGRDLNSPLYMTEHPPARAFNFTHR